MMTDALHFNNVQRQYGKQRVLNGVTLTVRAGEYLGLVGVNGAGKTTLIKSLLDFMDLNGGRIHIFDVPHRETRARARLAYLPEQFLPPHFLTGHEYIVHLLALHGNALPGADLHAVLTALDFDPAYIHKPVRKLSKGMAQKIGLAACLLAGKDLWVLDEPMSGLDPKARAHFKRYLLARRGGQQTLFFSTHMLDDVAALCDRLAILHEGRIRFIGTPAECCAQFGAADLEQAYLNCVDAAV